MDDEKRTMARKQKKEPEEERGVPKADDEFTSMASPAARGRSSRGAACAMTEQFVRQPNKCTEVSS